MPVFMTGDIGTGMMDNHNLTLMPLILRVGHLLHECKPIARNGLDRQSRPEEMGDGIDGGAIERLACSNRRPVAAERDHRLRAGATPEQADQGAA